MSTYFSVRTNGRIRLETLRKQEALSYARALYRSEGVAADILECPRTPGELATA